MINIEEKELENLVTVNDGEYRDRYPFSYAITISENLRYYGIAETKEKAVECLKEIIEKENKNG